MIAALIAAAVATPATAAPAAPAAPAAAQMYLDARPAIWVVNDEDTIIYLFGTFHALDGKTAWFNKEVKTAFSASNELVLETIVPEAPKVAPKAFPVPIQPVGPFAGSASFLSTSKTVMSAGRAQGMSTAQGADAVLREAAEEVGKPVGGLETFQFQLNMFSRLPGATPPRDSAAAARTKAQLSVVLAQLQAAWNRGDIDSFRPMLEQMRTQSPQTYKTLFNDRNGRWAAWIARRLQQPGTVFVAVGAGHLAGQDSVQNKLAALHVRSQRIN
jgi:uncharacterized protein YbaP (TraB family)